MRRKQRKPQAWATCVAIIVTLLAFTFSRTKSNVPTPIASDVAITQNYQAETSATAQTEGGATTAESYKLGIPSPLHSGKEQILYRRGYATSYNAETKLPNWVAWHLTALHCSGPYKRAGIKFHEDTEVAEGHRAVDWDYYNSGFDRGHMCPAGDNKWDALALQQSFLFTNICPQHSNLNRGDWGESEKACRNWAQEFGDIYIVCGPILYRQRHKTIGSNRVVVPEAFFKVVLCMRGTPKAIGFIYKNQKCNNPLSSYVNSVDQVERITGIDFFPALPDKIEKKVEATCNIADW